MSMNTSTKSSILTDDLNQITLEQCLAEYEDGFCINIEDGQVVSITEDLDA